eukprot:480751-Pelagomonas_calceolata.AAC.1
MAVKAKGPESKERILLQFLSEPVCLGTPPKGNGDVLLGSHANGSEGAPLAKDPGTKKHAAPHALAMGGQRWKTCARLNKQKNAASVSAQATLPVPGIQHPLLVEVEEEYEGASSRLIPSQKQSAGSQSDSLIPTIPETLQWTLENGNRKGSM